MAKAKEIAALNGYDLQSPRHRTRTSALHRRTIDGPLAGKIPVLLPFISDEISTSIRKCLRRSGLESMVGIVAIPPDNLKKRLVRNRQYDRMCVSSNCMICPAGTEGDCTATGVVYRISCRKCGDDYIGETGRPLNVRIKEHLDGKARSRISTPLGCHRL